MKNFKKILCLVLALSMVLALAACNNSSDGDKDKDNDQKTEGNEVTGNPEPETFEGDIEFTLPNGEGKVTAVAMLSLQQTICSQSSRPQMTLTALLLRSSMKRAKRLRILLLTTSTLM